jgi:hypothetical protein
MGTAPDQKHSGSADSGLGWRNKAVNLVPRIAAVGAAIAAVVVAGWVLVGGLKPDEAIVGNIRSP